MSKIGKILLGFAFISLIVFLIMHFLFYLLTPVYYTPLLIALLCFLTTFIVDFQVYKEFLFLKTTRYGFNMGTVIILCLILMVAINYIAVKNNKTWDLTQESLFTLADQTVEVLSRLEGPLIFKGFFVKGNQSHDQQKMRFREILRRYRQASDQVQESYINPHFEPALAKEYNVDESGGLFVEYKGQKTRIDVPSEEDVTNAIIKVTRTHQKKLYFFKNHGEIDLNTDGERAGSSLKAELESASYNVSELDALSAQGQIPDDADVLLVLGPQTLFLDFEISMIEDYLKKGGSFLLALDPGVDHNFQNLFTKLGVRFRGDYVIDQTSALLREVPITALGVTYSNTSSITEKFPSAMTLFFMASGWDKIDTGTDKSLQQEDIVRTSGITVATERLERGTPVNARGPFTLVKSIKGSFEDQETGSQSGEPSNQTEDSSKNDQKAEDQMANDNLDQAEEGEKDSEKNEFHAVLYGDSDIFTNSRLFQQLNRDLVLNTVAALAADEDLISIRPKSASQTTFKGIGRTSYRILVISAIAIPFICFIFAIVLYYRRRNA